MKRTTPLSLVAVLGVLLLTSNVHAQAGKGDKVIKSGSTVSLEYSLSDEKGKTIESNKGKEPLNYTQGQGQIIPGLEKELLGMKVGATKNVRVKPEDAYGPVNPKAFQEIPKANVPVEALKVGGTTDAPATTTSRLGKDRVHHEVERQKCAHNAGQGVGHGGPLS